MLSKHALALFGSRANALSLVVTVSPVLMLLLGHSRNGCERDVNESGVVSSLVAHDRDRHVGQ